VDYGQAGSLTLHITIGQIGAADGTLACSRTSGEYLPRANWTHPDAELAQHLLLHP